METRTFLIIMIAAVATLMIIGQRRFSRRGIGGLQHFHNYWIALIVLFIEWLLHKAAWAAILIATIKFIFH